jgi:hypothetical protein
MSLTDEEKAEFIRLAEETYDPGLWTEDDLPWLRAARRGFDERRWEKDAQEPESSEISMESLPAHQHDPPFG